ncbi:MAG: PQQ-binding-like beta-propeller repeat protein [Planctomycetaceae bacterium]
MGIALALSLCSSASAAAPPHQAPADPPPAAAEESADNAEPDNPNLFVNDRVALRRLRLAEERIESRTFDEAVQLLQAVLDAEQDSAAPVGDGNGTFYSLKGRALSLLSELPPDGQRIYELKYGIAARKRLDDAIAATDWAVIEEISRRYFQTEAGYESTYRLAIRAQDRGEPLHAAVLFEKLAGAASGRFEPQLSLRAALAWSQAGFPDAARQAAVRLSERNDANIALGGAPMPAAKNADEFLARIERERGKSPTLHDAEWPMFGRDPDRAAGVDPVTVAGGVEWSYRFDTPTPWDHPREAAKLEKLSATLDLVTSVADETGELTQPAFSPVVAGETAIFRTLHSIQAVDISTGRFLWRTEHPHDVVFDRALDGINLFMQAGNPFGNAGGAGRASFLEEYVAQYAWRNITTGTLSTDGKFVYGVEGVGTAGRLVSAPNGGPRNRSIGADLFNTLYAYELAAEGRIAWTFGGPPPNEGTSGRFFLGPPLPLGGRLYALADEDGEIRLIALNPAARNDDDRMLWSQSLVGTEAPIAANSPIFADPLRKLSGLSPSFSDGVLVCPTGSGAIVAVDLGQRLLQWGYQYPRNVQTRLGGQGRGRPVPFMMSAPSIAPDDEVDRWLDAAAQIADGRVYVTPRDSDELHCLDLHDGRLQWKRPRGAMLYLAAVHDGRAIVIGRRSVEALDAATGDRLWAQPIESEPAGRGVRSGDLYHLPLASGEIVTLQLATGQELGRSPVGEGVEPGNLIASDGRLLSQSTRMIAGFRKLSEFEADLRERLAEGVDPAALALRGEDRLHRGVTQAGLADLRSAVEAADIPRAKRLLTESLLSGLRTDFEAFRKYEDDLLAFADHPQQRLECLRLLADGLEQSGDELAAFGMYLRLCDGGVAAMPMEQMDATTSVRADRTLRNRIADLYANADADNRRAMDESLADRLRELEPGTDTALLERFVSLFHATEAAEAGLKLLAERYEAAGDRLRHERTLLRFKELPASNDSAAPARLDAGLPTARIDVAYRVEYIPDEIKSGRPLTEVDARFAVPAVGSRPAQFAGWKFEIDAGRRHLLARDRVGRVRWKVDVRTDDDPDARLRYAHAAQAHFCRHILAFVAGTRLIVLDLQASDGPHVLWSRELVDRRFGELVDRRHFGRRSSEDDHGPIGFAGAGQLVYQAGSTIVAADPLTGETFWQRSKVPLGCEISGDREFVVLQPRGAGEFFVLRTVDGSELESEQARTIGSLEPIEKLGTRLIAWKSTESGRELVCRDLARETDVWSWSFPETAKFASVGTREVAVLDPATGKLQVIGFDDGQAVLSARIAPHPATEFQAMRHFGRLLVFTRRDGQPGERRRGQDMTRVDGPAYAFDADGNTLWSALLPRTLVPPDQCDGLPVLFLTTTVHAAGKPQSNRAAVLDVRTGRLLVEQNRERPFLPFEALIGDGTGAITIAIPDARFVLTPTGDPLPPARTDGPEPLAEPATP